MEMYDSETRQGYRKGNCSRTMAQVLLVNTWVSSNITLVRPTTSFPFNGKRFDLPVLAKIRADLRRSPSVPLKYIYQDAQALITYDDNNNPIVKKTLLCQGMVRQAFDLLNNCYSGIR